MERPRSSAISLIDLHVRDLRDFTFDKHKTVDDSPYGGGAGMLMKPEPWGLAFDEILPADGNCTVIFTSPAGEQFKQATAHELAELDHIVFACGRYEGIDQRVVDYAQTKANVRLISLGDYVLNGGEVAALAMVEAIARLIPGVIGNAESLIEESHSDGLLEYPSYTKPASWRGLDVPEILTSGNHAAIAAWRHDQQVERTKRVRPDLLSD
jgi:tRNA (guanine37-N1)-methyltransferase